MQTFLPYPDFNESVACLDDKRLGNQRNECTVLINTIITGRKAWANHPATKMWRGYVESLKEYRDACVREWVRRGKNNSVELFGISGATKPPWVGNEAVHASHRSNLLRKDPVWYGRFNWLEKDNLPYIWPVM